MRSTRVLMVVALGVALAAFALVGCGGDDDEGATGTETTETTDTGGNGEAGGTLVGTVGPGFTITLTQDGANVTTLAAGTYTIEVDDQADAHNFHLTGPGVEETTDVSEVGQQTWEVTFEAGTYEYVCDPHASTMNGSFEVTG